VTSSRRTVLVYGALRSGAGADEDDTLVQVAAIDAALQRLGFSTARLEIGRDEDAARGGLRALAPGVVVNLVESIDGDGRLADRGAALCAELGIPYTGTRLAVLRATAHKPACKASLAEAGVPTPPWWAGSGRDRFARHPGPWIVKSAWEHASIGIDDESVVHEADRVRELLDRRARERGGEWFIEAYVEGREFNLALLTDPSGDLRVLPAAEIVFEDFPPGKPRIVGYAAKWDTTSFEYRATTRRLSFPRTDHALLTRLEECARACWRALDLDGYARVDFGVDGAGRPWGIEVNPNPCLAPDAGFAAAAAAAGMSYDSLVDLLVRAATARAAASPCSASAAS